MENTLQTLLTIIISLLLFIVIMIKPYFGVVLTISSLPVSLLLPQTTYISSVFVIIGGLTIVSYLVTLKNNFSNIRQIKIKSLHLAGLLFVIWIFISNPEAAWFGSARNWIFTFIQCWILLFLTGQLLNTEIKQNVFMWLFSVVAVISAIIAISEGQIGDSISNSVRAGSLAGQPNLTGRYLVIAMIFLSYLITVQKSTLPKLFAISGAILTSIGVFFTLSRSSILLLLVAVSLIIVFNFRSKKMLPLLIVYILAAILLWINSSMITNIIEGILPSIQQGTDTVGIRYSLWQAGWKMWLDHVISGVGIGMYPPLLQNYALDLPTYYWNLTAHNTYILILAETGIVGVLIFVSMMVLSLRNYAFFLPKDKSSKSLRNAWLIAFIVYSIGAGTMSAQYDKLLWFLMGASVYFQVTTQIKESKSRVQISSKVE